MKNDSEVLLLERSNIEEKAHGLAFPSFLSLKPTRKAVILREAHRIGHKVFGAISAGLGKIANVTQRFQWLSHGAAALRDKALAYSEYCDLQKQKIRLFEAIVKKQKSQWNKEINVWDHWQQLESYAQQHGYLGNRQMSLSQQREHISLQEGQFKHNPDFSCPEIVLEGAARRASITSPEEVKEHKEESEEDKAARKDKQYSPDSENQPKAEKPLLYMKQPQTPSPSLNSEAPVPPKNAENNSGNTFTSSVVHRSSNPLRNQ